MQNFTLDINFEWYNIRPSYLTCLFIVTRPFYWFQVQGHDSRSRSVFKVILVQNANFNTRHNFWMTWHRTCIFCMWISCDQTLMMLPNSRSSLKVKIKYQGHSFLKNSRCGGIHASQTHFVLLWKSRNSSIALAPSGDALVLYGCGAHFPFFWHLSKTMRLWVQYGILKIISYFVQNWRK